MTGADLTVWVMLATAGLGWQGAAVAPNQSGDLTPVRRVVDDYIGLYTRERLPDWKGLFLPSFTASYTNADGTVSTRTLEEFYESQRSGFARGPMRETLHDVRITREGHLAHAFAGFEFTSGGTARRGQLMLLLIESQGQFRIAALAFSYQ